MPQVAIAMGSESDLAVMEEAAEVLRDFGISYESRVLSAHRTPQIMADYAASAHERGIQVIIAGAGGAAHLPGMIASYTPLPVIGVPVPTRNLQGLDSLLSIVQMPNGVPVATVAIGKSRNAALLAVQIIGSSDSRVREMVIAYKKNLIAKVREMDESVQRKLAT